MSVDMRCCLGAPTPAHVPCTMASCPLSRCVPSPDCTASLPLGWTPTQHTSRQTRQVSRVALQASRLQSGEAEPQPWAFTALTGCHLQTPAGSLTSECECCPERRASSSHSWGFKCYEAMGLGEGCGVLSPSHFLVTSKHLESRTLLTSVGLKLEKNIHTFSKARRQCINGFADHLRYLYSCSWFQGVCRV